MCGGCTRCSCTAKGEWSCQEVFECDDEDEGDKSNTITDAINVLYSEVKEREKQKRKQIKQFVPPPPKSEFDTLIDAFPYEETFDKFMDRNERYKRSLDVVSVKQENSTVKFHNTVDELNEDTLKNSNKSGTIEAKKVVGKLLTRRKNVGFDKTELSSLHIEYNGPQDYEHHIAENKIDSPPHGKDTPVLSDKGQSHKVGNYSQATKDSNLSKIVVNELKKGKEVIGDKNAVPMSNITFTPENDTLTAMAFIAGNLLNKLWNMDKDSSESFESDSLKHQKINDLLELFKEPLNARQELFLKNALEKLSHSITENKNTRNVTICQTLDTDGIDNNVNSNINLVTEKCDKNKTSMTNNTDTKTMTHSEVAEKLTDVLNLIRKFENTQKALNDLREKVGSSSTQSSDENPADINNKFNLFGKVLEKVTKLLLPHKHSNKLFNKVKKLHQFNDEVKLKSQFSSLSVSNKDKIILDYINHIKSNPKCLLSKIVQKPDNIEVDLGDIKGNIFDSISDLLNGKSLMDLKKQSISQNLTESTSFTTQSTTTTVFQQFTKLKQQPIRKSKEKGDLSSAKERLKSHLQSIISDLVELQNERGRNGKDINITDILPCISNLIRNGNNKESLELARIDKSDDTPFDNMEKLIDALQLEFSSNSLTRRSDSKPKSTSARVWERIITNMNVKGQNSRRFLSVTVKPLSVIKKMIEQIEKLSGTYKNFALLSIIPAYKKRMLLKTLQADLSLHSKVLSEITNSFSTIQQSSPENLKEIIEFIDNTEMNIKLSNNVLRNLNKTKHEIVKPLPQLGEMKSEPSPVIQNKYKTYKNKNIKLTREQIMNQLMINRIQLYLKIKEEEGTTENDIYYNIGKRALLLLRNGNSSLAKELYNILIENKLVKNIPQTRRMGRRKIMNKEKGKDAILNAMKEPLLKIGTKVLQGNSEDIIFTK